MSRAPVINIGISTCPNDTFAFAGLVTGQTDAHGVDFRFQLLDIDELNQALDQNRLDVAKASFHAALFLSDRTLILPVGSALGFGVGPLLLASVDGWHPKSLQHPESKRTVRVLAPGRTTTATLLLRLFYGDLLRCDGTKLEQVVFSQIMPELEAGAADLGVYIHEGRFTWQDRNLFLVEDLGTRWEQETGLPLPLGGILANRSLPADVVARTVAAIGDSLRWAHADPARALPLMRQHAQEFGDDVLLQHVRLYVNEWTTCLGETGAASLRQLERCAQEGGILKAGTEPLTIFSAEA